MENIVLPYFKYIDTTIGLKYLNKNKKLYMKILNNFLNRYRDIDIEVLDENDLKDTIHSIKGLSSTLGMVKLSNLAKEIHDNGNMKQLPLFSKELSLVIDELQLKFEAQNIKTILVIDDKIIDIDILVEILGDKYDVVVALDEESALDAIESEDISIVLLDTKINNIDVFKLYNFLEDKMIPVLFIVDNLDEKMLETILSHGCYNHIIKPFNLKKIEKCISAQLKFTNII